MAEKSPQEILIRPKQHEVAWLVPTLGTDRDMLLGQISSWRAQTMGSDLVFLTSEASVAVELIKKICGPINILQEKQQTGSASSFFLLERWALERGYKKLLIADDDASCKSPQLVEVLSKRLDKGGVSIVFPTNKTYGNHLFPWFSMSKRELFEKIGLSYSPYFFAFEDSEFYGRILLNNVKLDVLDIEVFHPIKLRRFDMLWYAMRNGIAYSLWQEPNFFRFFREIMVAFYYSSFFLRKSRADLSFFTLRAFFSGLFFNLGKAPMKLPKDHPDEDKPPIFPNATCLLAPYSDKVQILEFLSGSVLHPTFKLFGEGAKERIKNIIDTFGKDIIVFDELSLFYSIFSRKSILLHTPTGKYYYHLENSSLVLLANVLFLTLAFPISLIAFLISFMLRFFFKSRFSTYRFGL